MSTQKTKIGLLGLGCVGTGFTHIIDREESSGCEIVATGVRHPEKPRDFLTAGPLTNAMGVQEVDCDVIVEAIDDPETAWENVQLALENGRHYVSANKQLIAHWLPELIALQQETGKSVLYEAAVCANIPILRNLETYFGHDWLTEIRGVLNGSTNYILDKVQQENVPYPEAVRQAIAAGFAESDPTLDVGGFDAKYKLCILIAHAFGVHIPPGQILNVGIQAVSEVDFAFAKSNGLALKQVAFARKYGDSLYAGVLPTWVERGDPLAGVAGEFNGILLADAFGEQHFLTGKGAGAHPTGAALFADVLAIREGFRYQWSKMLRNTTLQHRGNAEIPVYFRYKNPEILGQLPFTHIEQSHRSASHQYVTGLVTLDQLKIFQSRNEDPHFFLAQLPGSWAKRWQTEKWKASVVNPVPV